MNPTTTSFLLIGFALLNFAAQFYLYKKGRTVITRLTLPFALAGLLVAGFLTYWSITERNWIFVCIAAIVTTNSLFKLYVYWRVKTGKEKIIGEE